MSLAIRFASNIVLARLLSPEIFGALLIINTVRLGVELSSDVGFAQNVIQNKSGDTPAFFNTVWVMQISRGAILGIALCLLAGPISTLYALPVTPFYISGAILFATGCTSTSLFLVHRKLQLGRLNLFELSQEIIGTAILIATAVLNPTINALLLATLASQLIRAAFSHFLTRERNRIQFDRRHALEVLSFGRWIFLSSTLAFLCSSFDRLYLGKVAPLATVGIYGIARTLADVPSLLAARIGYSVLFPIVSSSQHLARSELRQNLSSLRLILLVVAAFGIAFGISIADIAVKLIYDVRYHEAAWMLPLLLIGAWILTLCSTSEYALLGLGKPSYNVAGSAIKLAYYVTMLPLAYHQLGMLGAILVIAFSETGRYVAISYGQRRERFSFLRQDAAATAIFVGLVIAMSSARWAAGYGTAFNSVPFPWIGS